MPSTAIIRVISEVNTTSINGVITQVQTLNKVLQDTRTSTTTATTSFLDMTRALGQMGSAIRQVGQGMMNMGMTLAIATAPLLLLGKEGLEAAAKFGQTEAALKAVTTAAEGGAPAVAKVGQNILSAAKNYTFGANEMLFATLMLKEAGFDLQSAQLAAVSGANLTTAAYDGAERTTEAYKTATMDLAKATRMFEPALLSLAQTTGNYLPVQEALNKNADIFSAVLNTSSARMDEFIQGFNYLAPVSAAMGMSLTDTSIAIGMVSDKGIDGSRAGREMASAFLNMSDASPKVKEAMDSLGISLFDANGKTKGMRAVIEELNTALFGMGAPLKAATVDIQTLGSKAVEASEKVTVSQAKFTSDQLLNAKKMADFMASTKNASQAQADAYKLAQSAIQGDVGAVEKQTLALMNNKAAWDKLSPAMRTQVQAMYRDADATLKSQAAYNKLIGTSDKLITTNGKLTDAERIRYAGILFGNAGIRAMIPLVQGGTDAWDKYTTAIENSGTAEEIAQRKLDNFKDSMDKLRVAVESAMIRAFGPIIDKYLTPLVQKLQEAVVWFDNLSQPVKEIIVLMAALLVAAGPILFMFGSLLFTIGMFTQGFAGLATVIFSAVLPNLGLLLAIGAPILGMFALLGLGIAGVATALITNSNGIRDQMAGPWGTILGYMSDLKDWLDAKIPAAINALKTFLTSLGEAFLKNVDWKGIFTQLDSLREALGKLFNTVFGNPFDLAGGKQAELDAKVAEWQKAHPGEKPPKEMMMLWEKAPTNLQVGAGVAGTSIGKAMADIVNGLALVIGKVAEMTKAFNDFITEIKPKLEAFANYLNTEFAGSIDVVKNKFPELTQASKDSRDAIGEVVTKLGDLTTAVGAPVAAGGVFDKLGEFVSVKGILENALDTLTTKVRAPADLINGIKQAIDSLAKGDFAGAAAGVDKFTAALIRMFVPGGDITANIMSWGKYFGTQLGTAIGGALASLSGQIQQAGADFAQRFGQGLSSIGTQIQTALNGAASQIQQAGSDFAKWFSKGWDEFWANAGKVVSTAATAIGTAITAAASIIAAPFVASISALKTVWDDFWQSKVGLAVTNAGISIGNSLGRLIATIQAKWIQLTEQLKQKWDEFWSTLSHVVESVGIAVGTAISVVSTTVTTALSTLITAARAVWDSFWGTVATAVSAVGVAVGAAIDAMKATITTAISGVVTAVSTVWNAFWNSLVDQVSIVLVGKEGKGGVTGAIRDAIKAVTDAWSGLIAPIQKAWDDFWNGLSNTVSDTLLGKMGANGARAGGVLGAIKDTYEDFKTAGSELIKKITEGIENAATDLIKGMTKAITDALDAAARLIAGWNPLGNDKKKPADTSPRAGGGSVYAGGSYLVGERGPELFTPSMSGSIVPNNMLPAFAFAGNSSRQTNFNLNYQHYGGEQVPQSEIQHLLQLMEVESVMRPS